MAPGLGLAAAAATAAPAAAAIQQPAEHAAAELKDPRTMYPKPPFEKQSQPWPGLVRDMKPRPDHGETSYKGSGRLMGRKALITGGDFGHGAGGGDRLCAGGR